MKMELHHAIKRRGALGYFASANTADGFLSLYGEAYNEDKYKALYILKGGPGTGKSTLLDKLAERAESDGFEYEVLLCSSDPLSLDGIIIDALGVAVIDGTAPHAQDPRYPGVCGEMINLGAMWDGEKLRSHRPEIEALYKDKAEAYARAYRLLAAAGIAERDVIRAYERAADFEKMDGAVKRLMRQLLGHGGGAATVRRFLTAHSVKGKVRVGTLDNMAETTVTVSRSHGFGYLYLKSLQRASESQKLGTVTAPDALLPEFCEAIYFPEDKVLVRIADDEEYDRGDIRINCGRFIRSETLRRERAKLRFSEKAGESLLSESLNSLGDAGRVHLKIEEIYKSAMDFSGVTDVERQLESKIFG